MVAILPDAQPTFDPFAPDPRAERLRPLVERHVEALSPWRPYVRRSALGKRPGQEQPPQSGWVAPFSMTLTGPDAQMQAYWVPGDSTVPTPPSSVDWTGEATITPRTVYAYARLTRERSTDTYEIESIGGDSLVLGPAPTSATLARHLAEAIVREDNRAFAASSNTNADPVQSIGAYPGITTRTASGTLGYGDLLSAYWDMVADDRHPSVAWVSVGSAKALRHEKGTDGDYLFPPGRPLVLDSRIDPDSGAEVAVPIVPMFGLPTGAIVADGSQIVATHRLFHGKLLKVDFSQHESFTTDRLSYRLTEAIDFAIVPGQEAAVTRITAAT